MRHNIGSIRSEGPSRVYGKTVEQLQLVRQNQEDLEQSACTEREGLHKNEVVASRVDEYKLIWDQLTCCG